MKTEEIFSEAKEIEKDLEEEKEELKKYKYIYYTMGISLICMIIFMIVPVYSIKADPNPTIIPTIKEVVPEWEYGNETKDLVKAMNIMGVKVAADKIASISCDGGKVCQAKAIYYFVRNNYEYISDPIGKEYIEDPKEFLIVGGGDCESGSIVIASLMESIGINTQLVMIRGHVYNRIKLPSALRRYQQDGWIYLDWTCKNCEFGEIPWKNWQEEVRYIEV